MRDKKSAFSIGGVLADRYRLDEVIGRGSIATVYEAFDPLVERRVALKLLHGTLTERAGVESRFFKEARAVSKLAHPNIVTVHEFGHHQGRAFIVFERIDGRTLREVLTQEGPLPLARAAHIAEQIMAALGEAHAKGVIHRDLRPENVLLTPVAGDHDFVKIVDFGLASLESEIRQTMPGEIFAAPTYLSPEQARGKRCTHKGDLYALGIIFYELIAGRPPFQAPMIMDLLSQHMHADPPPFASVGVFVPPELSEIVMWLLAKRTSGRPESAIHALEALSALAREMDLDSIEAPSGFAVTPARDVERKPLVPPRRFSFQRPVRRPQRPGDSLMGMSSVEMAPGDSYDSGFDSMEGSLEGLDSAPPRPISAPPRPVSAPPQAAPPPRAPSAPPRRIAHPPRGRESLNAQGRPSLDAPGPLTPEETSPAAPIAAPRRALRLVISALLALAIGAFAFIWSTRPQPAPTNPAEEAAPQVVSMGHARIPTHRTLFESEPPGARVLVLIRQGQRAPQRRWIPSTPGTLDIMEGSDVTATFHLPERADTTIEWRVDREALIHAILERERSDIRKASTKSRRPQRVARRKREPTPDGPSPEQRARAEIDYLRGIDAMNRGAPKSASKFLRRALRAGLDGDKATRARAALKRLKAQRASYEDNAF